MELTQEFYGCLLDPFLDTIRSDRTKKEYKRNILAVCTYFHRMRGERYSFEELDRSDAKEYFTGYLSGERSRGNIATSTFRQRLSVCRSFAAYLEKHIPLLAGSGNWHGIREYDSPFQYIMYPPAEPRVHTDHIIQEADMDRALRAAMDYDRRLFAILLLSLRMMLPQHIILSLKKGQFLFMEQNGRLLGAITFVQKGEECCKRIPSDIVSFLRNFTDGMPGDSYVFRNGRGNPMNPVNLSVLLKRFERDTGCSIQVGKFRTRGIIDLVAHNPSSLGEISDYTGLSKKMIQGYGEAFDRISDCIADRGSYTILYKKEP